jgi:DNA-binding beta-propeller fold protein YncE
MKRALLLALALAVAPAHASAAPALPLTLVADVALPGGATRFDYQWVEGRRLYIAHLGDSSLVVFDLDTQKVVQEVPNLPSVHGVVAAPSEHLVLATATADKSLALIDDQTLAVKSRVPAGEYPNGLAFDPASARAFVSNNSGPGIGVIDVKAAKALASIGIGGGAGNTQFDPTSGHVFAAVHGSGVLVEIDPQKAQITGKIALKDVTTCHGLLVSNSRAFAVCRGAAPALVVVDLAKRAQTASLPLPSDIDVLAIDVGLGRLYAAAETGTVAVFRTTPDVAEMGRGTLAPNAHSVAVDPNTHRVYFPLENVNGKPVLRVMAPP